MEQAIKCPHCLIAIKTDFADTHLQADGEALLVARHAACPNCDRAIIYIVAQGLLSPGDPRITLVHPRGIARAPLPPEVPERFAADYREASAVLGDSPKASAAVSRRLLQDLLREVAKVKKGSLDGEIQEALGSRQLPSWLAGDLDAVRTIGNFAAHPTKSDHSGEVVEVELGEAEWLLDVLEGLFDFYFVEPAKAQARRDALNEKLQAAGKRPLRTRTQ